MAINFNNLPSDLPQFSLPPAGYYLATITKAEMKQPNDASKPEYLSIILSLEDAKGKKAGIVFSDGQYESTAPAIQFKLQRFLTALKLTTLGTFNLKDLIKLIVKQQLVVEIEHTKDSRDKNLPIEKQRDRAQVRLFGTDIYWPKEEFKSLVTEGSDVDAEVPFVFDAADGEVPEPEAPAESTEY